MANLELLQENISVPKDIVQERNSLVSVVIPTYNRAGLVQRAVHSVLLQTFTDLEVIIVDDASTDNTKVRIKTLQQSDHRIKYLHHECNRGSQAARNTGIQAANGDFVAFLDSDDEWLPRKLESQMVLFSHKTNSPGVVYCGYRKVSADGDILHEYVPRFRGDIYIQTLNEWVADTNSLVVRKDFLERINGFDENIHAYQEWDLCIRLARECEFDFVPECLTLYHEHTLPSISKDYLTDAYGYQQIVDTYHSEILNKCGRKSISEHYLKIARLFIQADRFHLARKKFLKAARYNPYNIKAILHSGVSMLGEDVYKYLRFKSQNWK